MQRIVVSKNVDIFDYIVDFAIKQHNRPEKGFNYPEYWNIAKNHYYIKFCGANGNIYRTFNSKFNCEPPKYGTRILKWHKGNKKIEMSVNYRLAKKPFLTINYIVVNDEQVYKCRPCYAPDDTEKDSWRYWFEY